MEKSFQLLSPWFLLRPSVSPENENSALENEATDWTRGLSTLYLVICAAVSLLIYLLSSGRNSVIDRLPGPKRVWLLGSAAPLRYPETRMEVLLKWSREFRQFGLFAFWVGNKPSVLITSIDYAKKLLSSNENGHLGKGDNFKVIVPLWKDGLILAKPDKWRSRRKVLNRAFTVASLKGYMKVYNKHARQLLHELEDIFPESSLEPEAKDIKAQLWIAAFRIICETTMGMEVCEVTDEYKMMETLDVVKGITATRLVSPWQSNELIWYFHPEKRRLQQSSEKLHNIGRRVIEHHKKGDEGRQQEKDQDGNSIPGTKRPFVSIVEELIADGVDEEGLLEEIAVMLVTGFETSATTIQFLLFFLASHPEEQKKCRDEVDNIFQESTSGLSPEGDLTYEGLSGLKHLQNCIFETLRLFPIAFVNNRRLESPLKLDENLELPTGTNAIVFIPAIHRNPDNFPNPDSFIPDRFQEENSKAHSCLIPFSLGPRNCIGFRFGIIEAKVVCSWILRHFVLTTTDKLEDVKVAPDIVLVLERGYKLGLKRRQV